MRRVTIRVARRKGCDDLPLPRYASDGASGMDVFAAVDAPLRIDPGATALVPTGLFVAIPEGYEIQVRPRSGLALRHGITVTNSPGTIDSDYRGEVCIVVTNLGREPFVVNRGDRIAQLVVAESIRAEWEEVDSLDETARGAGGFGHTGL